MLNQPRLLTGDTPTGPLHLGHYVGSIERRLDLQYQYESYFLIANVHALTTRAEKPGEIRQHTLDIALDYLAVGIDPNVSTIFIQSEIPAIAELTILFSMLLPYPRLMRNPTVKDEIITKNLGENYPFGFLIYPIGQVADILAFKTDIVPVGEDQVPHIEMTREIARRFNQVYCGVAPETPDTDHIKAGGLLPIPTAQVGRVKRLVGITGPNVQGQLPKMSKSLNNAIFLSDDPDTIKRKVMSMYTDPKRLHVYDKGTVENNPLWIFHEAFNPDLNWVETAKNCYREGTIGDVECKRRLIDVLVEFLTPIRARREMYQQDMAQVMRILAIGTAKAKEESHATLQAIKHKMYQNYF